MESNSLIKNNKLQLKIIICCLFILLYSLPTFSAELEDFEVNIKDKVILGSNSHLPLWTYANKWGTVQETTIQNVLELSFSQQINFYDFFSFNYKLHPLVNASEDSYLELHELYGQFDLFGFSMYAGKKRQTIGDVYEPLSTGSMIISKNASPIPKVSAGFFDYVTIPYTLGILEIKGAMSHGWFQGKRYVKDLLLHEKYAYGKVNLPFGISPYMGLVHEALWGGVFASNGNEVMEVTFDNYKKIFYVQAGGEDALTPDQNFKLGNHLGMWDWGVYGKFDSINIHGYYQHYFEDNSGFKFDRFQNQTDGLWGLTFEEIPYSFINAFLFEFLKTTKQSGSFHDEDGVFLGGKDSYYYHYIYRNGWTHFNKILGNSLFSTIGEEEDLRVANNRIIAYHFGLMGNINKRINYKILFTYARYFQAYSHYVLYNSEEQQFHSLLEFEYQQLFDINGLNLSIGFYYDNGSLPQKFGSSLSCEWHY